MNRPVKTRIHHVPVDLIAIRGVRIQQKVLIYETIIDEDGKISEVNRLTTFEMVPPWPQIHKAAVAALRQWRYTPTLHEGQRVPVCMTVVRVKADIRRGHGGTTGCAKASALSSSVRWIGRCLGSSRIQSSTNSYTVTCGNAIARRLRASYVEAMRVGTSLSLFGALALAGSSLWGWGCGEGRASSPASSSTSTMTVPVYDARGDMKPPEGYRSWIFVGTSLGLSYGTASPSDGPGSFHDVYIQPEAYREFHDTGRFPEKTILAMESYSAGTRDPKSGLASGFFQDQ